MFKWFDGVIGSILNILDPLLGEDFWTDVVEPVGLEVVFDWEVSDDCD